ncbi:hypothetical protein ABEB36_009711 [Hypothenemus hampei]|uniref:Cytochrome c oxidase subunit 5B, mitochondrial n=1 Tax=Hypothenemus hampei TaxID=57062 RepID=A0ABD1EJD4_HYPHA
MSIKMMSRHIEPVLSDSQRIRLEIQEKLRNPDNPFNMKVCQFEAGTQNQPQRIPSNFDSRIVGCICQEESETISWMWLHKGKPRRCECGHWFILVEKA